MKKLNSFDTVSLDLPMNTFKNIDRKSFDRSVKTGGFGGVVLKDLWQVKPQVFNNNSLNGIANLKIDMTEKGNERINLVVSAKALKENYLDGITSNNVEQLINNINDTGIVDIDFNNFIDNSKVYKIDCTQSVNPSKEKYNYMTRLQSYTVNSRYKTDNFDKTGVVFSSKAKSNNERILFYDKHTELRMKRNKSIARQIGLDKLMSIKNEIRVEQNIRTYKDIRNKFNISEERYFKDILNSKEEVNYNTFKKITDCSNDVIELWDSYSEKGLTVSQVMTREGMNNIYDKHRGDVKEIMKFINTLGKASNKNTHWYTKFRDLKRERIMSVESYDYIAEFAELLKIA